jgi:hypothetical protein
VLALARKHIKALKKREISLEGEKEILIKKTKRLKRVLAVLLTEQSRELILEEGTRRG